MKGKLIEATYSGWKKKTTVVIELDGIADTEKWVDVLDVSITPHKAKRSLNANAYFHVLVDRMADLMEEPKAKVKNMMITSYGQPEYIGNDIAIIKSNVPPEQMERLEALHTIPIKYDGDVTFYRIYRGSHTYNVEEMRHLIDGTVREAKQIGVSTLPPDEVERLLGKWHPKE